MPGAKGACTSNSGAETGADAGSCPANGQGANAGAVTACFGAGWSASIGVGAGAGIRATNAGAENWPSVG